MVLQETRRRCCRKRPNRATWPRSPAHWMIYTLPSALRMLVLLGPCLAVVHQEASAQLLIVQLLGCATRRPNKGHGPVGHPVIPEFWHTSKKSGSNWQLVHQTHRSRGRQQLGPRLRGPRHLQSLALGPRALQRKCQTIMMAREAGCLLGHRRLNRDGRSRTAPKNGCGTAAVVAVGQKHLATAGRWR